MTNSVGLAVPLRGHRFDVDGMNPKSPPTIAAMSGRAVWGAERPQR